MAGLGGIPALTGGAIGGVPGIRRKEDIMLFTSGSKFAQGEGEYPVGVLEV